MKPLLINIDEFESDSNKITDMYLVLKNHEEQYSLWPNYKLIPRGWEFVIGPKSKEDCLNYVKETWVDMRPLSLREEMEKQAN